MRISDWSADVCSSDLRQDGGRADRVKRGVQLRAVRDPVVSGGTAAEASDEVLFGEAVLRHFQRPDRWPDRHPLRQRCDRGGFDVLELIGDDIDFAGKAPQRIEIAVIGAGHLGRYIGGGENVLGREDVAAVTELGCRDRQHPAKRSEEHTSELQSLMRISYASFCLKTKKQQTSVIRITEP